jgi:hypothetical protein
MKKIFSILAVGAVLITSSISCKKYLDVNSDPDTPQFPDPSSVFPTQLAAIPRGLQFDARYVMRWIQNLNNATTASAQDVDWDRMGFAPSSDASGDIWRQAYFGMGQNLNYLIDNGVRNGQYDYAGAAMALKAMIFQYAVDYHGQIIWIDAFKEQTSFRFDDEEIVYPAIDSMARVAMDYLSRTDLNPSKSRLSKGDYVYNGDLAKWRRFAAGILARNFHRYSKRPEYVTRNLADSVIKYTDLSLAAATDDFLIPFDATRQDDANFFGPARNNLTILRQSNYIVRLLDGTILGGVGGTRDPRIRHMLSVSSDSVYRGVNPGVGDTETNPRRRVPLPFGDSLYTNLFVSNYAGTVRKYLFGDKVPFPIMTASEMQFLKAEAAFLKGDKTTALAAYTKGISLHFDFINRPNMPRGNNTLFTGAQLTGADLSSYLASTSVKKTTATLQLSDIMLQKYIALWGWGFFETWVDMRRYHYTDIDPSSSTGNQVYAGFSLPSTLSGSNLGKPIYRVRPRFNSEYVWNRDELLRIGALNIDYHTYETFISRP